MEHNDKLKKDKHTRTYTITGRKQFSIDLIVILLIFAILLFVGKIMAIHDSLPIMNILPFIMLCVSVPYVFIQYFFYEIRIEKDRLFLKTTPFNAMYYKYNEIFDFHIVEKKINFGATRRNTVRNHLSLYFFVFTDTAGNKRKVLFNKSRYESEINELKFRIENANKVETMKIQS